MTLYDFLSGLMSYTVRGVRLDAPMGELKFDSRLITPGDAFIAVKGFTSDGHDFIRQAVASGASLVIAAHDFEGDIPRVVTDEPLWKIARSYFGEPELKIVGVTGTNGKTTVTHIVHECLTRSGKRAGLIGTNRIRVGERDIPAERTTPDALSLRKLFVEMAHENCEYCVMEVSSHALDQERTGGLRFASAAFTNLTRDHLDYHKDMEDYFSAKLKLFDMCENSAVCTDGEYGRRVFDKTRSLPGMNLSFGENGDLSFSDLKLSNAGVEFDALFAGERERVLWRTPGRFSAENAMCALGILLTLGYTLKRAAGLIKDCPPVKGRLEPVIFEGTERYGAVLIDYAHTPDALENVIKTAREFTPGKLICVFGCGGDRDRTKRPLMGTIACKLSDLAVLTSDNPRTENPEFILDEIEAGRSGSFLRVSDRKEAIHAALKLSKPGDTIILAGKGQETYQEINGVKHHMDEREILRELVAGKL